MSIEYTVRHHVSGRIKIHLPLIRGLTIKELEALAGMLFPDGELPEGIKKVKPNPLTGNVVIEYDPHKLDILVFIEGLRKRLYGSNLKMIKQLK